MPRVLYIQFTNPAGYPPLEHSSRILADVGWDVVFLGTGALGANSFRFPAHPRIAVHQLEFKRAGWRQKLHYARFCLWCLWWTLRWRPDWLYASDTLSCPAALLATTLIPAKLLYHEHDAPDPAARGRFARLCLAARRRCARKAKICIVPNAERADAFARDTKSGPHIEVVWNCPARAEVAPAKIEDRRGLRLMYHGSIVPERVPLCVLDAIASLSSDVSLTIAGYETVGSTGYIEKLRQRARELHISDQLHIVGAIPERSDLLEITRSCDVGLALMPRTSTDFNLKAMTGASNKPFDYLASGMALLVSRLPDWCEMFVGPGYGLCCDPSDTDSIANRIRFLYENPDQRRAMGERGRQKVLSEWNYETEFSKVMTETSMRSVH